ncbi:MAG: tRNA (adenosine(37)-N6)-threonylcarbamoyltransferase complex ATPase subunit type 1 TsaE [bacterium]
MVLKSSSEKETKFFAASLAEKIISAPHKKAGAFVIKLNGDLGAGKTTFTQGFSKTLGITRRITSPTFVIMKRHITKHGYYKNLYHIDAYRMKQIKDMNPLGFVEIIKNPNNIILIEWAENIKSPLLRGAASVTFSYGKKESDRSLKVSGM